MSFRSANSDALPLALMGDNVKSSYRYVKKRDADADPGHHVGRHSKTDTRVFLWYPLHDALRRFVVPPFNGPWTPSDEPR